MFSVYLKKKIDEYLLPSRLLDRLKMAAFFNSNHQYLVNRDNQVLVNFNASKNKSLSFSRLREPFLHSISMAEANLQVCKSLFLLNFQFTTDINLNYIVNRFVGF